jgi:Tol biopolymer transport system component
MKKRLIPIVTATLIVILVTIACGSSTPEPTIEPTLDPNVEKIAFSSTRKGNNLEIYVMDTSGKGITRLTDESTTDGSPNWSPDGTKIVFHSKRSGEFNLYIMNADGSGLFRLTDHSWEDKDPCWSPDGEWIAFHSYQAGRAELYMIKPDGTGLDKIETDITNSGANSYAPNWSPDGSQLAFYSDFDGDLDVYKIDLGVVDIYNETTFDWVGQNLTQLTNNNGDDMSPAFSPDGSKIAYHSQLSGHYEIYTMDVDGSNQNQLTRNADGQAVRATWSPDGVKLAYAVIALDNKSSSIWVINRDGTGALKLTDGSALDAAPAWQP